MPTRAQLEPALRGARLLALNSPLNPCGTAFNAESLGDICDLVLEENARRPTSEGPLYVVYDQVYWQLTFGDVEHVDPVTLRPEMARYTVFVDGISKAFAATGLRAGWVVAPNRIVNVMNSVLQHIGTWYEGLNRLRQRNSSTSRKKSRLFARNSRPACRRDCVSCMMESASFELPVIPWRRSSPWVPSISSACFDLFGRTARDGTVLRTPATFGRGCCEKWDWASSHSAPSVRARKLDGADCRWGRCLLRRSPQRCHASVLASRH